MALSADAFSVAVASPRDAVRDGAVDAGARGWIVSPLFDVLFFLNIHWLLALLPIYATADGEPYIQFWMAYFLATPHRWLTLVVAATDRDRRQGLTWLFVALAVFFAGLIAATLWTTGDFRSLFLFYTLFLGWHFAGQHRFVLKLYSARAGQENRFLEGKLFLLFILYTNLRLVSFFQPSLQLPRFDLVQALDMVMLAIPAAMFLGELTRWTRQSTPKLLYLTSCLGMWSSVLWTAHTHRDVLCSVLLAAVTVFHSVEYLAMVSYYAWRRRQLGSRNLFQVMAANWTLVFAWYVLGCGLLYSVGNAFFVMACYAVNTWASLLHCAYDGIMWRARDPGTAEVFAIEPGGVDVAGSG